MKITSILFILFTFVVIGCDDGTDEPVVLVGGTPAGMTTGGTEMTGPVSGMMTTVTDMAGMAGIMMTGGMEEGGIQTAGIDMGGTNAGVQMAGTMVGGMEMTAPDCSQATVDAPCVTSIYFARQPAIIADLISVQVEGVITAIRINDDGNASHIVLQDPAGGPNSGIWVYLNDNEVAALPIFTQGELVRLVGQVEDYFGQRQINTVTMITQLGTGPTIAPMVVNPTDVATNGVSAVTMEGVLVTVQGVSVESVNPPAGPGDMDPTNEFVVTGGLRVDDYLHMFTLPMIGDQFTAVTGVLRLGNGDYKLIPRSAGDLQR